MSSVETRVDDGSHPLLPNVSALPLEALARDDSGPLSAALRRALDELVERDGVISAFGSFAPDE